MIGTSRPVVELRYAIIAEHHMEPLYEEDELAALAVEEEPSYSLPTEAPPDTFEAPSVTLVALSDTVGASPDTVGVSPDTVGASPDTVRAPPDTLGASPDILGENQNFSNGIQMEICQPLSTVSLQIISIIVDVQMKKNLQEMVRFKNFHSSSLNFFTK